MTIAETHGPGWFARQPLARKAALAAAVPMAVGIGALVVVQATMLRNSVIAEAIRSDTVTAELMADQMIGGMKWSKADVIGSVIDRVTGQDGSSVAHVVVLDRTGAPFALYPEGVSEPEVGETLAAMVPGQTLSRATGNHVIVATPIGEFGTLAVAWDMEHVAEGATIRAWIALGLGLAMAAAVTAAIIWFLNRSVIGPIGTLTGKLGRLAEGDHDVESGLTGRADEIGRMAVAAEKLRRAGIEAREAEQDAAQSRASAEAERSAAEAVRNAAVSSQQEAVQTLAAALERLAGGDLTHRVSSSFPESYVKLRDDLNAAFEALETALSQITENAEAVRTAATDIATASDDLSRRTESQAASLEQTAAAIEEITATTRSTADNAARAREVVARAKEEAENGGAVVQEAIAAMSNIETSSEKIGQIIGLIDEISFQTNLLALNAGVEAARAGEAGKGFAVVASEVRALAQRSADAAKEIKGLIMSSKQEVEKGVELVGGTGEALERIIARVGEINGAVGEIATSASEQATGLQEVNGAVSQMDQITQQNAAMVDKASIAVRALSHQTDEFARLVGRFTVTRRAAPARPAAASTAPAPKPAAAKPASAMRPSPPAAVTAAKPLVAHKPAAAAKAPAAQPAKPVAKPAAAAAKASATVHSFKHKPRAATVAGGGKSHADTPPAAPAPHKVAAAKPAAAVPAEPARARPAARRASGLTRTDTGGWEEF